MTIQFYRVYRSNNNNKEKTNICFYLHIVYNSYYLVFRILRFAQFSIAIKLNSLRYITSWLIREEEDYVGKYICMYMCMCIYVPLPSFFFFFFL